MNCDAAKENQGVIAGENMQSSQLRGPWRENEQTVPPNPASFNFINESTISSGYLDSRDGKPNQNIISFRLKS